MDLDNFEFRPLTDGLGFDKTTENSEKKITAKTPTPEKTTVVDSATFNMPKKDFVSAVNPAPVSRSLKKMLDSLPPSVDFSQDKDRELTLKGPLAPVREVETPVYRPAVEPKVGGNAFDVTLNNSLSQAFPKEEVSKKFYHQTVTPIPQYKEVAVNFASGILDIVFIVCLASAFVVLLTYFSGVNLPSLLTHSRFAMRTLLELGALCAGVNLFYYMLSRGLLGSTVGEWAFDVQLGSREEQSTIMYPFQVLFRTFLIMVTGVIVVPLASLGFGKDLGYYFSGLKLYSRQY